MRWKTLAIPDDPELAEAAIRLNSLGSLYFFTSYVLRRDRLARFHVELCKTLESEDLHTVLEIPMSHFKTTCAAEGLPIWWSLPFTERDEVMMRELGYGEEWIRWMLVAHDQNTSTLITHETDTRVIAMGKAFNDHYENNDRFRIIFPEVLPDGSGTWNDHSKFHKRQKGKNVDNTTATYEFRSVGQALQGIHVKGIINDDSVGKAAQDSMLNGDGKVMEGTYRWWRQCLTRFDPAAFTKTGIGRQVVIGNRWGHADLNSMIRKNHPEFTIERHSAEGGCCKRHPAGYPIFPEEWSMERLAHERRTLGSYDYSHFMLNLEVMPEECIFRPEWIRRYRYKPSRPELPLDDIRNVLLLEHKVRNGEVMEDLDAGILHVRIIIDLAHAKKRKRCKHVIAVIGLNSESDNFYLLDIWAKASPYSELLDELYKKCRRWAIREVWLEEVGAQNLLRLPIEMRNRTEPYPISVNELPYDNSDNAKKNRIEAMEPIYRNGQFWIHDSHVEFSGEYDVYPASETVDVLDTIGYAPQLFDRIRRRELMQQIDERAYDFQNREAGVTGY